MLIGEDTRKATNLKRLERSMLPAKWIAQHPQGWTESQLDSFMTVLQGEGLLPLDRSALHQHLMVLRESTGPDGRRVKVRTSASVAAMQTVDRLAAAEWADPTDFADRRPYEKGDLWLNRSPIGDAPIGFDDDRHMLVCCGSRSGKGTSCIMPQHMLWEGSLVSVDPSGENATVTAARRGHGNDVCMGMGQHVHVLDPMNVASVENQYRKRFNPLDALDPTEPKFLEKASAMADGLIVRPPDEKDPVWNDKARTMVKGLILHIKTAEEFEGRRNLNTMRELVTLGDQHMAASIKERTGKDQDPFQVLFAAMKANKACGNVLPGIGQEFLNLLVKSVDKQWSGIHSSVTNQTEFLESPLIQECVSTSDFSLSELKDAPEGMSLYLCLPESDLKTYFRWLRVMINLVDYEVRKNRAMPACGQRVLMCLDEFAALERMEMIEEGISNAAKYGLKFMLILQNIGQLKKRYEKNWQTFLANTSVKLFFALDDDETAEEVSKRIGETDLSLYADTRSTAESKQTSQGESATIGRTQGGGTSSTENTSRSTSRTKSMSKSNTRTFGSSDSVTRGKSGNRGKSRGRNKGKSEGSSWNPHPLFFRNTDKVLPFFRDGEGANKGTNQGTSKNKNKGTGWNKSKTHTTNESTGSTETMSASESQTYTEGESTTESENWSETQSHGKNKTESEGQTLTTGINQSFHKRPLIYPSELRLYFARAERGDFCYPGLGLLEVSGERPMVVQRTHFFEDDMFEGMWDRDPFHPETQPAPLERFWDIGFDLGERGGLWDGHHEPIIYRWIKKPGDRVFRGEPLLEIQPGPSQTQDADEVLPVYAPIGGTLDNISVHSGAVFEDQAVLGTIRYSLADQVHEKGIEVDQHLESYNDRTHPAYKQYTQTAADRVARERRNREEREHLEAAERKRRETEAANKKAREEATRLNAEVEQQRREKRMTEQKKKFVNKGIWAGIFLGVVLFAIPIGIVIAAEMEQAGGLVLFSFLAAAVMSGIYIRVAIDLRSNLWDSLKYPFDDPYWDERDKRRMEELAPGTPGIFSKKIDWMIKNGESFPFFGSAPEEWRPNRRHRKIYEDAHR